VSTSGFYLSLNIGSLTGVTSASVLISVFVQRELRRRLGDLPNAGQIIRDVTSNFDSINDLPREVREIVLGAYTQSFKGVWRRYLPCQEGLKGTGLHRRSDLSHLRMRVVSGWHDHAGGST